MLFCTYDGHIPEVINYCVISLIMCAYFCDALYFGDVFRWQSVMTKVLSLRFELRTANLVTVMLVTPLFCWLYDSDRFEMLMAESLCWRLFSLCWRISQCIKSVTNILNRSPTSQTFHQHIWSPTSVTNIDATLGTSQIINIIAI